MFENNQASSLFLNSLRSAEKSGICKDSGLAPESINIVIDAIRTIMLFDKNKWPDEHVKDMQNRVLCQSQTLHATAFFALLKSNNITCAEAEKYYEAVDINLPYLSFRIYLYLNYKYSWSEFFIESARQFPPDVLAVISNKILLIEMDEQMKLYSWHLILQCMIWKFFMMDDPEFRCHNSYKVHSFDFPYSVLESSNDMPCDDENSCLKNSSLFNTYTMLLNKLFSYAQPDKLDIVTNFDFMKIIFQAFKLIFNLLRKIKICQSGWVKELFRLNPLLKNCCEDSSESNLKSFLEFYQNHLTAYDICYCNTGWKVNNYYLVFVLCNYWEEIASLLQESNNPLAEILSFLPSDSNRRYLMKLNPLSKEHFDDSDTELVNLLRASIQCDYAFSDRAAEILLAHQEVLISNKVMETLEENSMILCSLKFYKQLANAVVLIETTETKTQYLKLLHNVMYQASTCEYNEVLKHILHNWGFCSYFQLPDFDNQLIQFTRKTLSFEQAMQCLPCLFIQSPEIVLRTVIEQALMQGLEGMRLIQVLKYVPIICKFDNCYLITRILVEYLSKAELKLCESKNMPLLIQSLMEVQAEEDILSFDVFATTCLIPQLSHKQNNKIAFIINCLNTSIKTLINKQAFRITDKTLLLLLKHIGLLIDSCITSGNGRIKELVLATLTLLAIVPKENGICSESLLMDFKSLHPAIFVYISHFLEIKTYQDISTYSTSDGCELSWIWCCFTKDIKPLEEINPKSLSYERLLSTLVQLFFHFTMDEWIQCANILKEYLKDWHSTDMPSAVMWNLSESNFHLYVIIRSLMDSFCFLFQQGITDIHYVSSCFTNTVMNLLSNEVQPELLITVFIDVCHLSLNTDADILTKFSSFLLSIRKNICTLCNDKDLKDNYMKILLLSVKSLPSSEGKENLLQKLQ